MKKTTKSSKSSISSNDADGRASYLIAMPATDGLFQNLVNYKTYHLREESRIYNKKMAIRMGKYTKRIETLMKAYKFDNKDLVKILRFLTQIKRAWDSNRLFKSMALWIMSMFMKDEPECSLTVRMIPHKDDGPTHRLPMASEEQTFTYAEAVICYGKPVPSILILRGQHLILFV